MSSRAELIQMCEELGIDSDGMSIEEMTAAVRKEADKKFNKRRNISADFLSYTLKKFLYCEYNYLFRNKDGELVDYKGNPIPRSKRSR